MSDRLHKRSSVTSQTVIQPLILATSARSSTSMSSHNSGSQRSKRDSAVGLGGIAHRGHVKKRPYSDSDAMAPTYRLVRVFLVHLGTKMCFKALETSLFVDDLIRRFGEPLQAVFLIAVSLPSGLSIDPNPCCQCMTSTVHLAKV